MAKSCQRAVPKVGSKRKSPIEEEHEKQWGGASLDSIQFKRRKTQLEIDKENFLKAQEIRKAQNRVGVNNIW